MKWISTLSESPHWQKALEELCEPIREGSEGRDPDLLVFFASGFPEGELRGLPKALHTALRPRNLLGCTSGGVIGGGREVERRSAMSLSAAWLPDVDIESFHLEAPEVPKLKNAAAPHFILLADPYTFDVDSCLAAMDEKYPESRKIGGLASGGGGNLLFLGERVYESGMVGVALSGDLEVDTIVAQGCRPIGNPMFVTKCYQNLLMELDGKPVPEVINQLYQELPTSDQELFRHSLFLGLVMQPNLKEYRHGDFLIRNLLGMARDSQNLVVGAALREGQVVQFHLRDAKTSTEDLNQMLIRYKTEHLEDAKPAGALLFSCLGRGVHLFGEPDHDSRTFQRYLGDAPLGGFFCNGEIGPVHGKTYIHGYTSSFGIFRKK